MDRISAATTLMVFRTVDVYSDRASQVAVESFVTELLASSDAQLVSTFLTAFLKRLSLATGALLRYPDARR